MEMKEFGDRKPISVLAADVDGKPSVIVNQLLFIGGKDVWHRYKMTPEYAEELASWLADAAKEVREQCLTIL